VVPLTVRLASSNATDSIFLGIANEHMVLFPTDYWFLALSTQGTNWKPCAMSREVNGSATVSNNTGSYLSLLSQNP